MIAVRQQTQPLHDRYLISSLQIFIEKNNKLIGSQSVLSLSAVGLATGSNYEDKYRSIVKTSMVSMAQVRIIFIFFFIIYEYGPRIYYMYAVVVCH